MTIETEEIDGVIRIKDPEKDLKDLHYHGDKVRNIYIAMSLIMLIMAPFFQDKITYPVFLSIFTIVTLTMVAGLLNPKLKVIIILNFIVALGSVIGFVKESMVSYVGTANDLFFLGNVVLAILATFALYFSSKTVRGSILYNSK